MQARQVAVGVQCLYCAISGSISGRRRSDLPHADAYGRHRLQHIYFARTYIGVRNLRVFTYVHTPFIPPISSHQHPTLATQTAHILLSLLIIQTGQITDHRIPAFARLICLHDPKWIGFVIYWIWIIFYTITRVENMTPHRSMQCICIYVWISDYCVLQ